MNENILVQIAKILALPAIKAQMRKAEKMVGNEDPETLSLINSIKISTDLLDKNLDDFCKRHPESNLCKKGKNK